MPPNANCSPKAGTSVYDLCIYIQRSLPKVVLSCFDKVARRINKTTLARILVCTMYYRNHLFIFVPFLCSQGQPLRELVGFSICAKNGQTSVQYLQIWKTEKFTQQNIADRYLGSKFDIL